MDIDFGSKKLNKKLKKKKQKNKQIWSIEKLLIFQTLFKVIREK